jgi:hypothetical protein
MMELSEIPAINYNMTRVLTAALPAYYIYMQVYPQINTNMHLITYRLYRYD